MKKNDGEDSLSLLYLLTVRNASGFKDCNFRSLKAGEIAVDSENDVKVLSGNKTLTAVESYKDIKRFDWSVDGSFFYSNLVLVGFPIQGIPVITPKSTADVTNEYLIEVNDGNNIYKISSRRDSFQDLTYWLPTGNKAVVYINTKQTFYCDFPLISQSKISIQCDKFLLPFSTNENILVRAYSTHQEQTDTFQDCL
ncbi:hypothetical protein [Leptospira kobayashii]|nr:hypothetical protein [Leptospira kobayashii]